MKPSPTFSKDSLSSHLLLRCILWLLFFSKPSALDTRLTPLPSREAVAPLRATFGSLPHHHPVIWLSIYLQPPSRFTS